MARVSCSNAVSPQRPPLRAHRWPPSALPLGTLCAGPVALRGSLWLAHPRSSAATLAIAQRRQQDKGQAAAALNGSGPSFARKAIAPPHGRLSHSGLETPVSRSCPHVQAPSAPLCLLILPPLLTSCKGRAALDYGWGCWTRVGTWWRPVVCTRRRRGQALARLCLYAHFA